MSHISKEHEAEIFRLFHVEKWRVGTIARALHHHHTTVQRVLMQSGVPRDALRLRSTKIDPFIPLIVETLAKYPRLRSTRLYQMVKQRGYVGSSGHFRNLLRRVRPRPASEAFHRLRTLPGEEAQVDWGHFGKITIGTATRHLMAFVIVLSFSRQIFLRFFLNARLASFLRGHVEAFAFFGGVPKRLLYDNLKSAVLERVGESIRFHPTLLELAAHYRFMPRPVAPARGNEKGRVERAIRYIRDNFFAARRFVDVADLNAQAFEWFTTTAAQRPCPEDRGRSVHDVFRDEKPMLIPLPDDEFPTEDRVEVEVGKTPYVRYDLNDYSVPHTHVRRSLVVCASERVVRVLDGSDVIASHARSWDRGGQIEDAQHIEGLVAEKSRARTPRAIDHLAHAVPESRRLLRAIAERGGNIGNAVWNLTRWLQTYTAADVDRAVAEALELDAPHISAVRRILERGHLSRGEPPPVTAPIVRDPRHAGLVVRPHSLSTYDELAKEKGHDETN
jgi:transposase